jgi:hypothetical protein
MQEFFMHTNLLEVFKWTKFQIKIGRYDATTKAEFCRKSSLKIRYLIRNELEARTHFRISKDHSSLHDADSLDSKTKLHLGILPR